MRVCAVADLHGRLPVIPACDVLLIAGDFCDDFCSPWDPSIMRMRQMEWLNTVYREWEKTVPAQHILATPGNHDWIIRLPEGLKTKLFIDEGYEVHDDVVGRNRTFWFSPWVKPICDWNYMLDRGQRKQCFETIPRKLDVLVCHSPAYNVFDKTWSGKHAGCEELRQVLYKKQPSHFCYGHIHEAQREAGPNNTFHRTGVHNCAMFGQGWEPVEFDLW